MELNRRMWQLTFFNCAKFTPYGIEITNSIQRFKILVYIVLAFMCFTD